MRKMVENDLKAVKDYLYENLESCIYLYIDLQKYGLDNPNVTFWISEKDGKPYTVAMKYYDSIQVFCNDHEWDAEEMADLIKKYPVTTICGEESLIQKLSEKTGEYDTDYGIIVRAETYQEFDQFSDITKAEPKDAMQIAKLVCSDDDFGENYDVPVLAQQLADRMREGVGRSFVLWQDGEIAAHVAAFAETEEIAVLSGLIAKPEYRNKLYGMIIHEYIKKILLSEGKAVYAFRIKARMKRYAKATGEKICGHYGKMTRRKEK